MFTVVIPLYNKESTIEETLKSVQNQTISDFDIIVVNDGSTDRSRERAARLTDSRIKILDQPNKGVSAARNLAIRHSTSPISPPWMQMTSGCRTIWKNKRG